MTTIRNSCFRLLMEEALLYLVQSLLSMYREETHSEVFA